MAAATPVVPVIQRIALSMSSSLVTNGLLGGSWPGRRLIGINPDLLALARELHALLAKLEALINNADEEKMTTQVLTP